MSYAPELLEFGPIPADVIDLETQLFVKDFWMKNRVGAMIGASVADYNQAQIILGWAHGEKPLHLYIVGPDVEGLTWNEVMTSPGSNGWMPEGEEYNWDKTIGHSGNFARWIAMGAPKSNKYGNWANNGLPLEYVQETWIHPSERNLEQFKDKYGLGGGKGGGRNRHGGRHSGGRNRDK